MARPLRLASIVFLIIVAAAADASAQGLERVPAPIDIRVSAPSSTPSGPAGGAKGPIVVPPGTAVRISGTTVPLGSGKQVRVDIKPPAGAIVQLNAPIAAEGAWTATFNATHAPGTYAVTALTADGKGQATASFTVASAAAIGAIVGDLFATLDKGAADASAALAAAQQALAAKTPYPGEEAVTKNMGQIDAALKELPSRYQQAKDALSKLGDIAKQYPGGAGELEPLTTTMQENRQKLDDAAGRVRSGGVAAGKTLGVCDRIDAVNEVLSAASLWFDLQGLLFQKIIQLATDKFLPDRIYNAAVPAAKRDNTEKFALGENLKAAASALGGAPTGGKPGAAGGLVDFVKKPQNLLLDTTQMLTGLAFDKLCEKFTGPVTGTFTVDATINGGQKFWGYKTLVNGKITLMYEKQLDKPGQPVPMTGEIEGNGFFTMYEDLMAFNTFNRQFVIYRGLLPPIGTSAAAQQAIDPLGKVGRMGTPGYFRVPVKGSLAGSELTITIGDAAYNDFSDLVKGRAVYVVLAPAAPIPYVLASDIPVQKAQFILSRGVRTTGALPVTTSSQGKAIVKTAVKTFERKEVVSNGEVTVTWNLQVKACNPDCP